MPTHDTLVIDLETRSYVDLPKFGLENYAKSDTTEILVLGYCFNDEPVETWIPGEHTLPPKRVYDYINKGYLVVAHNVAFEIAIFNFVGPKYGLPKINIEQTNCTMSLAYRSSFPGKLANAAPASGLASAKDLAGQRIMMQLSKPKKAKDGTLAYVEDDDKFQKLVDYCKQDVEVERELYKRLTKLSDRERKIWHLDFHINQRGVPIDVKAAKTAIEIVEAEKERLNEEINRVSENKVGSASSVTDIARYVRDEGFHCEGVDRSAILKLLDEKNLSEALRRTLEIRQEAAKSSTSKLETMLDVAGSDDRVRNTLQYYGANTGRWAGRSIQVQNFPRPNLDEDDVEECFRILGSEVLSTEAKTETLSVLYGPPMSVISDCLRGFIQAPKGKKFVGGDWAAIEARVLAWLAGEEKVLKIFNGDGKLYEATASAIYRTGIDRITAKQRQIGKVASLALGYQGGVNAFQKMAQNYGVKVTDEEAEVIKTNWREANQKIVKFWYDLERAAKSAIENPGKITVVKNRYATIRYVVEGSFLICELPSKRSLYYPYPKIELVEVWWDKEKKKESITYKTENGPGKKWERVSAYGGYLAENITQAVARDLLAETLLRFEENNVNTIFHVHDEIVAEVDENDDCLSKVKSLMEVVPVWATGLPIKAEVTEGKRFKK